MFLLLGTMPVYAVIQDRGFQTTTSASSNDAVMTSIANMDKTLSALNSKLPSLIESRFMYYESIQRQNQVKQVIAELGAFLIALMVYALIRNKNDRETERALTRSEQILTNIETRINTLENLDEVNVNVVNSDIKGTKRRVDIEQKTNEPIPPNPIINETVSKQLLISTIYEKYYLDEEIDPKELYCETCINKMADGTFKSACKECMERINNLLKLQKEEQKLIKKQLSLDFCDDCLRVVGRGGLQRGFIICDACQSILNPKPKDNIVKSVEKKDKDVVEVIEVAVPKSKFPDGLSAEEKSTTKQILYSGVKQQKLKTDSVSKKTVIKKKIKKDKFLGLDSL